MTRALSTAVVRPEDPADLGFPAMFPYELAMKVASVPEICAAYGIDKDEFVRLTESPLFVKAYGEAKEQLQKAGASFRIKAQLQAEELLKKSWAMIHSQDTPTPVKADLIKSTVRWAGLEPSKVGESGPGNNFQILINLG